MNTIVINGKAYVTGAGNQKITVINNKVMIDGVAVSDEVYSEDLHIKVEGSLYSLECGGNVEISGDVGGNVNAHGDIACRNVGGDVSARGNIACEDIKGNVESKGNVDCGNIAGSVTARGNVVHG
jgi:cytoskeletal protein CcmA (bactofilin family)